VALDRAWWKRNGRSLPASYQPRVVGGQVMLQADLERLHKYMVDIEGVEVISDEMRAVVEELWPELTHKLPPRKPQG
jgi:hypothetical protein